MYIVRGVNRQGHGILEINDNGYAFTVANERLDPQRERRWFKEEAARQRKKDEECWQAFEALLDKSPEAARAWLWRTFSPGTRGEQEKK